MSLLNFACIGFPAFILALEHNTERIKNRFLKNILQYSFPIGLTVSVAMLALSITANILSIPRAELTTASVLITFIIDLVLIYWISRPLNLLRGGLFLSIIAIVAGAFFIPLIRNFFEFVSLSENTLITAVSITAASIVIFEIMKNVMGLVAPKILKKA